LRGKFNDFYMKYVRVSLEKVKAALAAAGLTPRDLVKEYYGHGPETKGYFNSLVHENMKASKLCKVCNIIGCRMDDIFEIEGDTDVEVSPHIHGNHNNVNSTVINQDVTSLRSENQALKQLIEEKDKRIKDLQNSLNMVIALAQGKTDLGQSSPEKK